MNFSIYQIASIVLLASHIVITIKAFQEDAFQGAMCLFVPGWIIYYGFRRLNVAGRELFVLIYIIAAGIYFWGRFAPLGAGGPDACALLTPADAAQYLGGPVGSPTRRAMGSLGGAAASACMYATTSSPRREIAGVYGKGCTSLPRATEQMRSSLGLRGLTDEAFVGKGQVLARKGTVCIGIFTRDAGDGLEGTVAREQLARKMLERAH